MRGQPTLPTEMTRTFIAADDSRSLFYRKLRSELRQSGIDVVDTPVDATAVLTILGDDTGQRVLSVSARNVPREYEVYYRITFSLESDETTMLAPREHTVTRNYTYDETLVLGKAREEELLREAIADDLVRIVFIQLSSLKRESDAATGQ